MNEQIELLALEKDFAVLSAAERDMVLAEMSPEEFEHLRTVVLNARQMDAGVLPPLDLKAKLLERMGGRSNSGILKRAFSARIPAWQALSALFLIGVIVWFMKKETVREKVVTENLVRVDTVWQVKTVWRDRVIWREKVVYREISREVPIALLPEKEVPQKASLTISQPEFSVPRVGTSLGDTPELIGFFIQGDR
ncbi:MAG: hypothetical protein ACKVT2_13570 [Saprospiraceae bacterium]